MSSTTTTIVGVLMRDPEIRYTRAGLAVTTLAVAAARRPLDVEAYSDDGEADEVDRVLVFDVMCWRGMAENVALSLTKGARVVVTGRLNQRAWESEDGQVRTKVEVVADEVGASLADATVDVHRNRHSTRGGV